MMTNEIKIKLFADYFQFHVQDEQVEGNLSDQWTEEAIELLLATTNGTIGVGTVRNMSVPVTIRTFDTEPLLLSESEFDQINECNLDVTSGKIVVAGCCDYFPDAKRIELAKGIYRARIYYGNLDKVSENGLDGEDFYEIHLWQTGQNQSLKIIKNRFSNC
jgi:hypothetical protein